MDKAYKLVREFLQNNDLDLDMERVKLTRTLRTIYERKTQEEVMVK